MRRTVVVLALLVTACGDDGPSETERVAAVCDAWQEALDSPNGDRAEVTAEMQQVARVAIESETYMSLLGGELSEALVPFDQAAFEDAAAGFEESC